MKVQPVPSNDTPADALTALVLRATPVGPAAFEVEDLRSCRRWSFVSRRALDAFLRAALPTAAGRGGRR
jgi:hypothetical protein